MVPTATASPDYAALLRGVLLDPADDLPRLVLADWLDERGGTEAAAEAAFIREAGPPAGSSRTKAFREYRAAAARRYPPALRPGTVWPREPGNITGHAHEGVIYVLGPGETMAEFRHGFAVALACSPATFRRHAAEWFARNPITAVAFARGFWPDDIIAKPRHAGFYRSWHDGRGLSGVPDYLFGRLDGHACERHASRTYKCYPDGAAAYLALSRAAVAHGRESADLPLIGGV